MHNEIVIKYAGGWAGVGLGLNYTVTVTSFQFECNYLCDILCDGYKNNGHFPVQHSVSSIRIGYFLCYEEWLMSCDLFNRHGSSHMAIDRRCGFCHMMEFVTINSISVIEGEDLFD